MFALFLNSMAQAGDTSIGDVIQSRGYVEFRASAVNSEGTPWQTIERSRPSLFITPVDRVKLTVTPQLIFTQGRYEIGEFFDLLSEPIEANLPQDMTLEDVIEGCDWNIESERQINEVEDFLTLERLMLDIYHPNFDLRIGRQALNWGSAQFFNPTDVLAQNLLATPWQERQGVDAMRLTIPMGQNGQAIVVGTLDESFEPNQGAIKMGRSFTGVDIYGVGSVREDNWLVGLDMKGDWTIGWWLETAFSEHFKWSLGADYSFPIMDQLVVSAQLSHDGSGEDPLFYDWASRQDPNLQLAPCPEIGFNPPTTDGPQRTTLGRWYAVTSQRLAFRDRWNLSNAILINLADQTGLFFPSMSGTFGSYVQVNAGLQYLFGSDGEFQPPATQTQVNGIDTSGLLPKWTALTWARLSY